MFFYTLFSLAGPPISLILVAWAALTIWRAVTFPRRTPSEPVCERCKYAVVGVAGFTCPECGSDLRQVGIATPRMELIRRSSLVAAIVAWTFLWAAAAFVAAMLVLFFIGFGGPSSTQAPMVAWVSTFVPKSSAYWFIELEYQTDGLTLTDPLEINLTLLDGTSHPLTLDPVPMTAAGLTGGPVTWDKDTLAALYEQAGLDTSDPQVISAADEVTRVIDLVVMSPMSGFSLNLAAHTSNPPMGTALNSVAAGSIIPLYTGLFWLTGSAVAVLLYALGIVLMVRRRRRLLRGVVGAAKDSPPSPN